MNRQSETRLSIKAGLCCFTLVLVIVDAHSARRSGAFSAAEHLGHAGESSWVFACACPRPRIKGNVLFAQHCCCHRMLTMTKIRRRSDRVGFGGASDVAAPEMVLRSFILQVASKTLVGSAATILSHFDIIKGIQYNELQSALTSSFTFAATTPCVSEYIIDILCCIRCKVDNDNIQSRCPVVVIVITKQSILNNATDKDTFIQRQNTILVIVSIRRSTKIVRKSASTS